MLIYAMGFVGILVAAIGATSGLLGQRYAIQIVLASAIAMSLRYFLGEDPAHRPR